MEKNVDTETTVTGEGKNDITIAEGMCNSQAPVLI